MQHFILRNQIMQKELEPLFVIDWKCFKDSPEVVALFSGGLDPARRVANVGEFRRSVFGGPTERAFATISDTQNGDVISFISCRVYRGPMGIIDGDFAKPPPPISLPQIQDREDRAFWQWYWTSNRTLLRSFTKMQAPHIFIQGSATDPAWQRHGAATMLMQYIFDVTVKAKIGRCALQASLLAMSFGFYEKFGFHVIDRREFTDEARFPGKRGTPFITMVKNL